MKQEGQLVKMKFAEIETKQIVGSKYELRHEPEAYVKGTEQEDLLPFTNLVESIKSDGILHPILVIKKDNDKYEIVDGGRRFRAAKEAGLTTIPAIVTSATLNEGDIRRSALIANIHRKDLTHTEKVKGIMAYYESQGFLIKKALEYINTIRNNQLEHKNEKITAVINLGIPEKFWNLFQSLAIAAAAQWYLLTESQNFTEPILQHMDNIGLPAEKRKMLVNTALKDKPITQKKLATEIVDMPRESAHEYVKQTVKDIEKGEYKEPEDSEIEGFTEDFTEKQKGKIPTADRHPSALYLEALGYTRKLLVDLTAREVETFTKEHIENSGKYRKHLVQQLSDKQLQTLEERLQVLQMAVDDILSNIDNESRLRQRGGR